MPAYTCKFDFSEADGNADTAGMITKEGEAQTKRRKIYSLKRKDLTGVPTKKFMFSRKKTFIGIILSLSVGSVLF